MKATGTKRKQKYEKIQLRTKKNYSNFKKNHFIYLIVMCYLNYKKKLLLLLDYI